MIEFIQTVQIVCMGVSTVLILVSLAAVSLLKVKKVLKRG